MLLGGVRRKGAVEEDYFWSLLEEKSGITFSPHHQPMKLPGTTASAR